MRFRNAEPVLTIGIIVVVIVLIVMFTIGTNRSNHEKIREWCSENRCEVVEISEPFLRTGPFWYKNDDQRIYRVQVIDYMEKDKVVWFRIGPWRLQSEWE